LIYKIQRPSPEGEGLFFGGPNRRLKAMCLKGGDLKPRARFAAHFVRAKAAYWKIKKGSHSYCGYLKNYLAVLDAIFFFGALSIVETFD
jgi:hypothetical protein